MVLAGRVSFEEIRLHYTQTKNVSFCSFSYADLANYARLKKNKTYICKPDSGCQGRGIFITKNPYKDIKPGDNYVAQVYVSRVSCSPF